MKFEAGALGETWSAGKADYTVGAIGGTFSPQGGDGNGHYDFRIGVIGILFCLADAESGGKHPVTVSLECFLDG